MDPEGGPSTNAKAEAIMPIRGNFLDRISEVDFTKSDIRFGLDDTMLNESIAADELLLGAMEKRMRPTPLDTSILN